MDFNPRSREGSDDIVRDSYIYADISIHAPAKGANRANHIKYINAYNISIHAPAKGATIL